MKKRNVMEAREIGKLAQINEISRAIEKHLDLFNGDTAQLDGALSIALNMAMERRSLQDLGLKKSAIVTVKLF